MCPVSAAPWDHGTGCLPSADLGENTLKEAGDHHQHAEDKTAKFYLLQKDISRDIRKPQVSVVKKKKKKNQTSAIKCCV